jgi:hypothetical protein
MIAAPSCYIQIDIMLNNNTSLELIKKWLIIEEFNASMVKWWTKDKLEGDIEACWHKKLKKIKEKN